jgi:hypothetical protein
MSSLPLLAPFFSFVSFGTEPYPKDRRQPTVDRSETCLKRLQVLVCGLFKSDPMAAAGEKKLARGQFRWTALNDRTTSTKKGDMA